MRILNHYNKPLKGSKSINGCLYTIIGLFALSIVLIIYLKPKSEISFKFDKISTYIYLLVFAIVIFFLKKYFFDNRSRKELNIATDNSKGIALNIFNEVSIINPFAGVLLIGGAGSGKSKSIVEPIIQELGKKDFSGIIYDFKFPELAEVAQASYLNSHVTVNYIDFTFLNVTSFVNPIDPSIMTNATFAREFATTIIYNLSPQSYINPDFWSENSILILSAVFWYLREENPNYCTLPHAISLILSEKIENLVALLQTNEETKSMIAPLAISLTSGAQNQTAGILSTLQLNLNKLNLPEIFYVCGQSSNNISLQLNDQQKPQLLVIGNNPSLSSAYSPVIGLIISVATKLMNQKDRHQSTLLIDEFPTLILPKIEQIPATARSNKIATILASQDISQISSSYGDKKCESILSNLGNQIYGRTTNIKTAERVSTLFGKEDKQIFTQSVNRGSSTSKNNIFKGSFNRGTSESYTYQERSLVKTQDVFNLNTGQFYVQLSEGTQKQGLITVPYAELSKQPLSSNSIFNVENEELKANFLRIRSEASNMLDF